MRLGMLLSVVVEHFEALSGVSVASEGERGEVALVSLAGECRRVWLLGLVEEAFEGLMITTLNDVEQVFSWVS